MIKTMSDAHFQSELVLTNYPILRTKKLRHVEASPSAFVGYVRDWTDFLGTKTEFQQQDVIGHSPGYKKVGDLSRSAAMRQSRLLQS